jgi:hypothetical protein
VLSARLQTGRNKRRTKPTEWMQVSKNSVDRGASTDRQVIEDHSRPAVGSFDYPPTVIAIEIVRRVFPIFRRSPVASGNARLCNCPFLLNILMGTRDAPSVGIHKPECMVTISTSVVTTIYVTWHKDGVLTCNKMVAILTRRSYIQLNLAVIYLSQR